MHYRQITYEVTHFIGHYKKLRTAWSLWSWLWGKIPRSTERISIIANGTVHSLMTIAEKLGLSVLHLWNIILFEKNSMIGAYLSILCLCTVRMALEAFC